MQLFYQVTRLARILFLICLFGLFGITQAQEIPKGVRYKKTSDELNSKAQVLLENIFSTKGGTLDPTQIFDGAPVCGPKLWLTLKPHAGEGLQNAKPVVTVVPGKRPFVINFRAFPEPQQQAEFYKLFREQIVKTNSMTVRKALASELEYYWALIPFDIEEPLLIADLGPQQVIVNFTIKNGQPKIFWIDLVGNLDQLAAQVNKSPVPAKPPTPEIPEGVDDPAIPKGWKRYRVTYGQGLNMGLAFPSKPVAFTGPEQIVLGKPVTMKVNGLALNTSKFSFSSCYIEDLSTPFEQLPATQQPEFLELLWKQWGQSMVSAMNQAGEKVSLQTGEKRPIKVNQWEGVEQDFSVGPLRCRIRMVPSGTNVYVVVAAWTKDVPQEDVLAILNSLELKKT